MTVNNRNLLDAFNALARMGELDGVPPMLAFRLALNRNHLTPIVRELDLQRLALAERHGVKGLTAAAAKAAGKSDALVAFNAEYTAFMEEPMEFAPPAVCEAKAFNGCKEMPKPNDLAALLLAGVVKAPVDPAELRDKDRKPATVDSDE